MIEVTFMKLSTSGSCVHAGVDRALAPSAVHEGNGKHFSLLNITFTIVLFNISFKYFLPLIACYQTTDWGVFSLDIIPVHKIIIITVFTVIY